MDRIPFRKVDKETLVAAIRSEAMASEDGKPFSPIRKFLDTRNFTYGDVRKVFRVRWSDAIRAAGCVPRPPPAIRSGTDQLLVDWANSVRKLKQIPTHLEHDSLGRYSPSTIARGCGGWSRLPDRFRKFAEGKKEWKDVLALLPPPGMRPAAFRSHARSTGRVYGEPLDYKNLRHAPVNEMGVVHLFGAMSEDLGFLIESVQGAFPDCEAKQRSAEGKWLLKRIEFEYESRHNFKEHGHPPEGCDMIVCWTHNWPDCPKHLEVIALGARKSNV